MSDIFISYSSNDKKYVKSLVEQLEVKGFSVWWDRSLLPGQKFHNHIQEALDNAKCVIVVWSTTAIQSQWVRAEASQALSRNILLPIKIDNVKAPLPFDNIHTADFTNKNEYNEEFRKFIKAIEELVENKEKKISSSLKLTHPYKNNKKYYYSYILLILIIAVIFISYKKPIVDKIHKENNQNISIAVGSKSGTFTQFGKDIKNILHNHNIKLSVRQSDSSLYNIRSLASKGSTTLAIVSSDVLSYLKKSKSKVLNGYAENIRLVMPLYEEQVHIVTNKKIRTIIDLNGKKVSIGKEGSGTNITAKNILSILDIKNIKEVQKSSKESIAMLLNNEIDALFIVAGKPIYLLDQLVNNKTKEVNYDLNILSLPRNDLLYDEYSQSTITKYDYSIVGQDINTVSIRALLVAFDHANQTDQYSKEKCSQLKIIGKALRSNIDNLALNGHPLWKRVMLDIPVGLWKYDYCSSK